MTIEEFTKKYATNHRPQDLGIFDSDEEIAYDDGYNNGYEEGFEYGFFEAMNILKEQLPKELFDKVLENIH
jgi:hypothetical protein